MASYDVALTSSAEKELRELSGQLVARVAARLENLVSNPRPSGCKKLKGGDDEWLDNADPSPKGGIRTLTAGPVDHQLYTPVLPTLIV